MSQPKVSMMLLTGQVDVVRLTILVNVFVISKNTIETTKPAAAINANRYAVLRLSWKGKQLQRAVLT